MSDAFRNVLHGVLYGPPAGTAGGAGGRARRRPGTGGPRGRRGEVRPRQRQGDAREARGGGAGRQRRGGRDDPDAVAIEADLGDLERRVMALLAGPGTGLGQELGRIGS
ncbi:hypothetical protein THAOC_11661 [Thalassiosira oceanica]|uniref:Uncharacterized protein n=1 Tax=Thalassiosira oceanica TaxID=159749 RepID=K0SM02_THAOC|nr:hypothetical protein THAOC_11661 [Thalassiosira oceanica]|eukprot:EJK67323.1 hypothetical protein THAOC_11661 [Thalassiosira oceanica]